MNTARLKAHERALEFVKKYPALFTEDKDFWVSEIKALLISHESDVFQEKNRHHVPVYEKILDLRIAKRGNEQTISSVVREIAPTTQAKGE